MTGANVDAGDMRTSGQIRGPGTNDCGGTTIVSAGYNHSSDGTCGFTGIGDFDGAPALLGALGANGGPTRTHTPLPGSAVIGSGDPTGTGVDQRGITRPNGGSCDKGAVDA